MWALTWGASTAIQLTCSQDTLFTPGDTFFISVDIANPFAAPARFGFTVDGERSWPLSYGGGSIGGFALVVHMFGFQLLFENAHGGTCPGCSEAVQGTLLGANLIPDSGPLDPASSFDTVMFNDAAVRVLRPTWGRLKQLYR